MFESISLMGVKECIIIICDIHVCVCVLRVTHFVMLLRLLSWHVERDHLPYMQLDDVAKLCHAPSGIRGNCFRLKTKGL